MKVIFGWLNTRAIDVNMIFLNRTLVYIIILILHIIREIPGDPNTGTPIPIPLAYFKGFLWEWYGNGGPTIAVPWKNA